MEKPARARSKPALERTEGTPDGKAPTPHNAITHGITSAAPVIPGVEDPSDWRRHLDGIVAALSPEGDLEEALAERIASLFWRLRRVTRYEVAVTLSQLEETESDLAIADAYGAGTISKGEFPAIDPERVARAQETRILPYADDLDKIMRYEAHLHRQCLQALHEIEALQARRRGEQTPLARLDISSPPSAYIAAARGQAR